ncbi:DUF2063 domain-containing protein [Halioxenophilus sp. WMMB6]|uniref:HvfC family RiPP maturation protein n=1 Tax=Halioxenophilus sp. WMMB6 TaxID=3073815 RepID=UPI00295F2978|nr:putative DNA-binding domain-containing protein [Halioxenophilus sp. WMMB6]
MSSFQQTQRQLIQHLRAPGVNSAPGGIEDRRLQIYRDLIYNNIQNFIAGGFPILRKITDEQRWHELVRSFIVNHQATSPYFLDIGREFLTYLQEGQAVESRDPPFLLELVHYEWVELALDIAEEELPDAIPGLDLLAGKPQVSPLVWCLSYQYPVHQIGPGFQPESPPEQPTFLIVYRNRDDKVKFMESNAVTHRLLQLLQTPEITSGRQALLEIAEELQAPEPEAIVTMGADLLEQLRRQEILC